MGDKHKGNTNFLLDILKFHLHFLTQILIQSRK